MRNKKIDLQDILTTVKDSANVGFSFYRMYVNPGDFTYFLGFGLCLYIFICSLYNRFLDN